MYITFFATKNHSFPNTNSIHLEDTSLLIIAPHYENHERWLLLPQSTLKNKKLALYIQFQKDKITYINMSAATIINSFTVH